MGGWLEELRLGSLSAAGALTWLSLAIDDISSFSVKDIFFDT